MHLQYESDITIFMLCTIFLTNCPIKLLYCVECISVGETSRDFKFLTTDARNYVMTSHKHVHYHQQNVQ